MAAMIFKAPPQLRQGSTEQRKSQSHHEGAHEGHEVRKKGSSLAPSRLRGEGYLFFVARLELREKPAVFQFFQK